MRRTCDWWTPCSKFHSCDYTRARSALVPQAMKIVNKAVRIHRGDGNNGELAGRFNEVFAATMEKLSAPLLRQSDNGSTPSIEPPEALNLDSDNATAAAILCA